MGMVSSRDAATGKQLHVEIEGYVFLFASSSAFFLTLLIPRLLLWVRAELQRPRSSEHSHQ